MSKKLYLFVWENVLTDYTPGLACALAETEKQAVELLRKEVRRPDTWIKGLEVDGVRAVKCDKPCAFYVCGGG